MSNDQHPDNASPGAGEPRTIDVDTAFALADKRFQAGHLAQARQLCNQILEVVPLHAGALNLLGIMTAQEGATQQAEQYFSRAILADPDDALSYYNIALVQKTQGRLDEAIESYQTAIRKNPQLSAAYINLGAAWKERGAPEQALACYQSALEQQPGDPVAHNNAGNLLRELGRYEEAVHAFEHALELKPDYTEAHNNLGVAHQEQGRADEAAACFYRAIELNPRYASPHFNLGNTRLEQGRLEDAAGSYRAALRIDPGHAEAHHHLAMTRRHEDYDEDIRAMQAALSRPGLTELQQVYLNFGLGKALEDIGRFEQAFDHFARGGRIKRGMFSYDIEAEARRFEAIAQVFDAALFEAHGGAGEADPAPVFIVGMPRSGTTLVEQILASHPQVSGAGELPDLQEVITRAGAGRAFPGMVRELGAEGLRELGAEYLRRLKTHAGAAAHVTDKMPLNFLYIGMIRLMLPRATIVHCRRDPLDTCLSCFKHHFVSNRTATGHRYSYDLGELGRYYRLYQALMSHWHEVLPGLVFDVSYEALVSDPQAEAHRLIEHCGLPWDEACLNFHESDRGVKTASAAQVRRPIYKDAVQGWRRYEQQLQPLLEALGPEPTRA